MEEWRYLPYEVHSGAENMAIDEALLEGMVKSKKPQPVLRFYGWSPATLSLGYAQSYLKEVNEKACREANIDVVRRPTGGRAILHQYELTYSVIAPENEEHVKGSITESYLKLSMPLLKGLQDLGVPAEMTVKAHTSQMGTAACFDAPSWYELVVDGKKLVGSAQTRRNGILLQHGSIMMHLDVDLLFKLLKTSNEEVRRRLAANFKAKACALDEVWTSPFSLKDLESAICLGFQEVLNISLIPSTINKEEKQLAEQLVHKYCSSDWNLRR